MRTIDWIAAWIVSTVLCCAAIDGVDTHAEKAECKKAVEYLELKGTRYGR